MKIYSTLLGLLLACPVLLYNQNKDSLVEAYNIDLQNIFIQTASDTTPYQDAIYLNFFIENNDWKSAATILRKYIAFNENDFSALLTAFKNEPLLIHIIRLLDPEKSEIFIKTQSVEVRGLLDGLSQTISAAFGGLLSQDIFIKNLSQLIASRFQEELNISYVTTLKKELEKEKYRDLRALIPNSLNILRFNDPIEYKSFIPALRESMLEDIIGLPANLPEVIMNNKDQFSNNKEIYVSALAALFSLNHLNQQPADIFEDLARTDFIKELPEFNHVVQLLGVFSENLRSNNSLSGWYNTNALSELSRGKTFPLFIGLLLLKEQNRPQVRLPLEPIKQIIKPNSRELRQLYNIIQLMGQIQELSDKIRINQSTGLAISEKQFNYYVQQLIGLLKNGLATGDVLALVKDKTAVDKVIAVMEDVLSISNQITNNEIEKVVVFTINLLQKIFPESTENDFIRTFSKYSNLAIDLINADSEAFALTVLETAALPVKSYRTKRLYPMEFSISAYPGLFGGIETFTGNTVDNLEQMTNASVRKSNGVFGFTAPVGFALSLSKGKSEGLDAKTHGAFTFFAPLIDLGAIATFRIQDETALLPEFSFKNVFAPGLFGIYGFKNSPISIGAGFQYGPEIREVTVNEVTVDSKAWRIGINLAVDIPLLRIFTKERKN